MSNQFYDHPLFHPLKLEIQTPAVSELRNHIMKLLWTNAIGGVVLGFTRAGKTTALKLVENSITNREGNLVPVVRLAVHRRDRQQIRSLLEHICISLELPINRRSDAGTLKHFLKIYLAEQAKAYGVDVVILVIDEAQRLAIPQIDVFAELYDCLREEFSILLLVLFVGNKEQMKSLLNNISTGPNQHIQGRFFRSCIAFHGLRSVHEVEECLAQYDRLRFPKNGQTYTEFFLESDVNRGFKLSSLATDCWSVFNQYRNTYGIDEWGMEFFIRAINVLIVDYLHQCGADSFSEEIFENCVEVSGLIPTLVNTGAEQ